MTANRERAMALWIFRVFFLCALFGYVHACWTFVELTK